MKTGAIFPSHMDAAVMAETVGAFAAGYPLTNTTDLVRPTMLARATSATARSFTASFSSPKAIQAVALIGHNASAVATARVRVYLNDTPTGTVLYDSGALTFYPGSAPNSRYRAIRPFILPQAYTGQCVLIDLSANTTAWEIEALEIGGFWEWPGISYGRDMGVKAARPKKKLVGGSASAMASPRAPRTVSGQIDLLALSIASTTGLDFQKILDLQRPFVWAEDFDTAAAWVRKCMLVRNEELPPMVGKLYRHDTFPIRLVEHLR